jgi:zinc protease
VKKHKPLIEKYLGALPVVERNETYRDLGIRPPKTTVDKVVNKGKDQKCVKMIIFSGEMEYTLENRQKLDAICKILSTRFLEEIREKESGVYSIGAYPRMSAEPYGNYMIYIFFSTDPQREAELTAKIFDIIKYLQNDGLNELICKKPWKNKTRTRNKLKRKQLLVEIDYGSRK